MVNSYDIREESVKVKGCIGVVPATSNLYDELTVWDNIVFMAGMYHVPRKERETRIQSLPKTLALSALFTATSVGPAIVPWEARAKTLERLISSPVSIWTIFLGDVLSSFLFGALVSVFPIIVGLCIGVQIVNPLILGFGVVLATFCFASFSILLSAYPPTDTPASVMMLSSMIKFPLVFISGIFVPIEELPALGKTISAISPLTYFTDLARHSIQGTSCYPIELDLIVLIAVSIIFLVTAIKIHERTMQKRI